jgi:predicted nucleotidyltransferase
MSKQSFSWRVARSPVLISDVRPASAIRFRKEVETKMTAQKIIDNVTRKLEGVPGIVGVVLGGSRARGTHRPDSDIDIGIYYDESAGFDVARLNEIALRL